MSRRVLGLREITIDLNLFLHEAVCVIGSFKNLESYVRYQWEDPQASIEGTDSESQGLFMFRDGRASIIWLPERPVGARKIAALVHECMHMVHYLMKHRGMKLTDDTDELYSYTIMHAVYSVLKAFK